MRDGELYQKGYLRKPQAASLLQQCGAVAALLEPQHRSMPQGWISLVGQPDLKGREPHWLLGGHDSRRRGEQRRQVQWLAASDVERKVQGIRGVWSGLGDLLRFTLLVEDLRVGAVRG